MATCLVSGAAFAAEQPHPRVDPWTYLHHAGAHVHPVVTRPTGKTGGTVIEEAHGQMPPEVKQSIGCLLTGGAATVTALAAGAENLVNVVSGGLVTSANPVVLYMGVVGVVFASFCAIGQALTPLYLYYVEPTRDQAPPGPPDEDCANCRQARQPPAPRHATGPLAREFHHAGIVQAERARAVAASAPPTTVPGIMAILAGPLVARP